MEHNKRENTQHEGTQLTQLEQIEEIDVFDEENTDVKVIELHDY